MDPLIKIPTTYLVDSFVSPANAREALLEVVQRVNGTGIVPLSQYGNLNQAVTAIGSLRKTLVFDEDTTLTGNITIPANVEIVPMNGAVINHGSYTVSYSGSTVKWPCQRVFNGTGAVTGLKFAKPVWFGAVSGSESSAAVQAAANSAQHVLIPKGTNYVVKNVVPKADQLIEITGSLTLPSSCADGDSIFSATGINGIKVIGKGTLDGNKAGQVGAVSQQLIKFIDCNDCFVGEGLTLKKNYSGGTTAYAACYIKGLRNKVDNVHLLDWSKEGIWLDNCSYSSVSNIIAIDADSDSWSAVQVGGATSTHNRISGVTTKNTGASGVGLDSMYSSVENAVIDGVRYQNGLNLGHTGKPASYSTISNVVVKGIADNVNSGSAGLNIGGGTAGVVVSNLRVVGSTQRGVNIGDGASLVDLVNIQLTDCVTGVSIYKAGQVNIKGLTLSGTVTNGIIKDTGAVSDYTVLTLDTVNISAAVTRIAGAAAGLTSPYMSYQAAIFDSASALEGSLSVAALGAGGTVTVTNANARSNSRIILEPSNTAGAAATPFISTQNDGSFVITTVNSGGAGAFVRWKLI